MKILLLEDEFILARSIRTYLLSRGYFVDYFDNGQDVLDVIKEQEYDCYILDINTPLIGGLECLKAITILYPHKVKIIISAYHDIDHISNAFSIGCSDYLKKPFNLKELEIRIDRLKLQIPEKTSANDNPLIILSDHYTFNKNEHLLYFDGEVQTFTKREYALIVLFASNLGQIMSDENIRCFIWDGEDAEASTIRSLVNRVRQKLKEELVINVRGFGYMMKRI